MFPHHCVHRTGTATVVYQEDTNITLLLGWVRKNERFLHLYLTFNEGTAG